MFKVWPRGIHDLQALLSEDLEKGVSLAANQGVGPRAITGPANALYSIVFEATGIDEMGSQFARQALLSIPDTVVRRSFVAHYEAIQVAMVGTQWLGVRAALLVRYAPLFGLLYAVGIVDGLTLRAIRRASGGRESAGLYHRAKYLQLAILGLGAVGLLLWPGPVRWTLCLPLGAVLAGVLVSVQWRYYKKHM